MTYRLANTVDVYSFPKLYFLLLFGGCISFFGFGSALLYTRLSSYSLVYSAGFLAYSAGFLAYYARYGRYGRSTISTLRNEKHGFHNCSKSVSLHTVRVPFHIAHDMADMADRQDLP
jgi:hypothetical protein